ncbi:MAG: energy-coupling factor transporter ATPase [Bacteroidales bacterium]|nr:energy-coupling factor transporter ATPase [Clostridium sp.]MCM1203759.1 energy-coupling factor transporter ATPase [Bacteroidales bacterium]
MKLVDIRKLTFEYFRRDTEGNVEEMVEALKDVSLEVNPGEFIAILGRNGSGKSTLAKHINALLLPGGGEVIVDGMDTLDEEVRLKIRQTAGMVFQNPDNQIVGNLVEEDVAFGLENLGVPAENIQNRVTDALAVIGMEKYRNQSPNHLSGGQKQRLAIAGVLAMEPKCIIFDEATAMLDPGGRKQMMKVIKWLQEEKGITIILITHHMDEVLSADRVFVMKDGSLAGQGTPAQMFKQKELLEECGLCLPALQEYLNFVKGQELLSEKECLEIGTVKELTDKLSGKYAGSRRDADAEVTHWQERRQKEKRLDFTQGIILNQVSYVYHKGFADEKIALQNVNLEIGKGEFIAIIGHTGSGKSTLIQHLNGLYLPTEGNVYFHGQDIADKDFPIKELRQKAGLLFQYPEYQLFAETVEKDVCFGPENMNIPRVEAQKRAYEAIAAVGLPDTIYDTSPLQLSGGQKRRAAIAGILAMQPEYLILDEPTAGLDPVSARALLDMLKEVQEKRGMTIIMVSHTMEEVAEYAERIVVMEQGKICMDGAVWEIFRQEKELNRLGLSVPVGISLLNGLKNAGIDVDITKVRQVDICGELLKLKD